MQPDRLIPRPATITALEGEFRVNDRVTVVRDRNGETAAAWLRERLGETIDVSVAEPGESTPDPAIHFAASEEPTGEAYRLTVSPAEIRIEGGRDGLFRGAVTLARLFENEAGAVGTSAPCCEITDEPAFPWRGLLLDCSRHFLSIDYLTHAVDLLADLGMNRLQLHFVDNQGWRMPIDTWPDLIGKGSCRMEGPGRTGSYSKTELRELVAYARRRHVEIVPEIEIPGHSFAAVTSYPDLCCTGRPEPNPGHSQDILCAGKESTFQFLDDVLEEVTDIFPFEFVHLGGDEAPKNRWRECPACRERIRREGLADEEELQSYLFARAAALLRKRGRRAIGWEEILDGNPEKDIVVHWWRYRQYGDRALREALARGHQVIASPNRLCYLNFPVEPDEHFAEDRTTDLRRIYLGRYAPTDLSEAERGLILGAQCCLWTEYCLEAQADAMLFPRILACAERMWSDPADDDYAGFRSRVYSAENRWRRLGIRYGPAERRSAPAP